MPEAMHGQNLGGGMQGCSQVPLRQNRTDAGGQKAAPRETGFPSGWYGRSSGGQIGWLTA